MTRRSPTGIAPVLQVHPSRRCNLACAHCYSSSGPSFREELPLELLAHCMDEAAALGYGQLAVSGGEPLLYRELPGLLSRARAAGLRTSVTTNGMLLSPARWARLAALVDTLALSIDGPPDAHDRLRRQRGAFAATLANLDAVRASGVPFGFIFTLTRYNADDLEFMVRLAADQGARTLQVHPLTLHGRAATDLPGTRPDALELEAALVEASLLGGGVGVAVHVDALRREQIAGYREHLVPELPVRGIADVAPVLVVEADGSVVPLTHEVDRRLELGSLLEAPLSTLGWRWLTSGRAERLVHACERTWTELMQDGGPAAAYWFDEVAARTRETASLPLPNPSSQGEDHGKDRAEIPAQPQAHVPHDGRAPAPGPALSRVPA